MAPTQNTTPVSGVAMPEWLTRRDVGNGPWQVLDGPCQRGEAWTIVSQRIMQVPVGGDETNRLVRAHEMMHARVTPPNFVSLGKAAAVSEAAIRAAEEFRVNTLVDLAGFDVDLLADGSEKRSGERIAEMEDYAQGVTAVVSLAGTKGCAAFLRGVKSVNPDMALSLREVEKGVKAFRAKSYRKGKGATGKNWGNTEVVPEGRKSAGYPRGFLDVTIPIAQMIDAAIQRLTEPVDETEEKGEERPTGDPAETIRDIMKGRAGRFAPLAFGDTPMTRTVRGNLARKRIATNSGVNPRRVTRMLTDPQRRVFDRKRRTTGGVVVIDMSGSMHLTTEEVERMVIASPGCTVIGYSHTTHRRGGQEDQPNIWVLAQDGRRVENIPTQTSGNGVDGPAVEYAVKQARKGDPVVWVCDGYVTSCDDDACYDNLDEQCARLVRRHGVHMTETVGEGIEVLAQVAKGHKPAVTYTGNVLRAAHRLGLVHRH